MSMRFCRVIGTFSVLLLNGVAAHAQLAAVDTAAAPTALEAAVDRAAADILLTKTVAGFAVGIARGGEVALVKGYGFADLEDGIKVGPDTVFRVGSVTKEFTAASVLLLAERGQLSLDDRLSKYLPDFPRASEVTLRQLLNHTSGISNYTSVPGFMKVEGTQPNTTIEMTDYIGKITPLYDFAPGTSWNYSNSGYMLLGAVIEKVSGQSFGAFMKANVTVPLGMKDTAIDELTQIVPGRADGYEIDKASATGFANASFIAMEAAGAAGAVRSTVGDLLKWHDALLGGRLLKPASVALMTQPARLVDGRLASAARAAIPGITPTQAAALAGDYGMGIMVRSIKGRRSIGHGGSINGFNASLNSFPDDRLVVVALTNTGGGAGAVVPPVLDALFAQPKP